jgi:hypothetical protein
MAACAQADGAPSGDLPAEASRPAGVATAPSSAGSAALAETSASATATASAPVVTSSPRGRRGLWIWEFGKKAPDAARAAELAASWGVGRVFVKANNGDQGPRWASNASAANLSPFLARGIEVWLFGYFYPPGVADQDGRTWGDLDAQVAAALALADAPGVQGFVVDAEEEFKGHAADAESLCRKLRAKLGSKKLAYTTYGWISPNRSFPYATFDAHCGDAFLPQVYYAFGWPGDVDGSLDRLEKELAPMKLRAPVWPVQSNERAPSADRMNAFFARSGPDASIFHFHGEDSAQTRELARVRFR